LRFLHKRKDSSNRPYDLHRGPISQHLRDAIHDLIGVIAHIDDSVSAPLGGMLHHILEGFLPRLFAKVDIDGYLSAENCLQSTGDIAEYTTGADSYAADNAEVADNAISIELNARGDHRGVNHTSNFLKMDLFRPEIKILMVFWEKSNPSPIALIF
jgi:hypothetical protein